MRGFESSLDRSLRNAVFITKKMHYTFIDFRVLFKKSLKTASIDYDDNRVWLCDVWL